MSAASREAAVVGFRCQPAVFRDPGDELAAAGQAPQRGPTCAGRGACHAPANRSSTRRSVGERGCCWRAEVVAPDGATLARRHEQPTAPRTETMPRPGMGYLNMVYCSQAAQKQRVRNDLVSGGRYHRALSSDTAGSQASRVDAPITDRAQGEASPENVAPRRPGNAQRLPGRARGGALSAVTRSN